MKALELKKPINYWLNRWGVVWKRRNYDRNNWGSVDIPNRCISSAISCLYGISEAAVLAAGYAPAIGFIHTGKLLSFVYDIADLFKFDEIIPHAFKIAAKNYHDPEREVRLMCRDIFRQTKILKKIIPTIEEVLAAGEIKIPKPAEENIAPVIPNPEGIGNVGHRN